MRARSILPACLAACASFSCGSDKNAGDAGAGVDAGAGLEIDRSICDPENGPFSSEVDNPYLPFEVGIHHVLEGMEGGTSFSHFEVTVPDETAEVGGVTARVVVKSDGPDPAGGERSFFAQAPDGTVCLYGEDEDSDGVNEWEAGVDGYLAVPFMPATPTVGQVFENHHDADLVERAEVTFVGTSTETPAGTFDDTVTILEDGPSIKKYARGIGEIYDDGIELISY
jgi:hypothetical protein